MLSALLLLPSHLLLSQSCLLWLILIDIRERQEECPKHLGMKKNGVEVYSGLPEAFVCSVK